MVAGKQWMIPDLRLLYLGMLKNGCAVIPIMTIIQNRSIYNTWIMTRQNKVYKANLLTVQTSGTGETAILGIYAAF